MDINGKRKRKSSTRKIIFFLYINILTLSWIGIIVKIIIIFMVGVLEWNSIKSSLPKYLQEKLNGPYNEYIDEK